MPVTRPIALIHYENAANEACGTLTFPGDQRPSGKQNICRTAHIISSGGDTKDRPRMHIKDLCIRMGDMSGGYGLQGMEKIELT